MSFIDIHELLSENESFASLPNTFYKLREVVADSTSDFNDIAEIISIDPRLTLGLLKIINNAFYGFSVEIDTVFHALGIVGIEQLMQLVFSYNGDWAIEGRRHDRHGAFLLTQSFLWFICPSYSSSTRRI